MINFIESLPLARDRAWIGYLFAIASAVIGLGARIIFGESLGSGYPYVTFFPVVMLTAFLFGMGPGLFAGLLCGLAAKYFYIAPLHSFAMHPSSWVAIAFYMFVVITDVLIIHLMQVSNHRLALEREATARASATRELMFQELQHRVSNKLQIIASLLSLQRRTVHDPDARKALEDAARRVGTIGRISRALHHPDGGNVGLEPLLRQVAADILDTSGASGVETRFAVDASVSLHPDAAVPFALIYAEAVSNALEHAFHGEGRGTLDILVTHEREGGICLVVADDGAGLPADFDLEAGNSLGLRIAATLARQLRGRFVLEPGAVNGTRAVVTLPA